MSVKRRRVCVELPGLTVRLLVPDRHGCQCAVVGRDCAHRDNCRTGADGSQKRAFSMTRLNSDSLVARAAGSFGDCVEWRTDARVGGLVSEHLLDRDRQRADPRAGRVVYGIGNRSRHPDDGELPYILCSEGGMDGLTNDFMFTGGDGYAILAAATFSWTWCWSSWRWRRASRRSSNGESSSHRVATPPTWRSSGRLLQADSGQTGHLFSRSGIGSRRAPGGGRPGASGDWASEAAWPGCSSRCRGSVSEGSK